MSSSAVEDEDQRSMSSRIRSGGCNGPRLRRTWIRRVPTSRSCSIDPSNWLPPNRSSPPWLVRSQLSSAATYVSNGTSTIRRNDSDSSSGTMLVLMPSAPPARGALGPAGTSSLSSFAVRPLPPHRTKALYPASAVGLGTVIPEGADLSRLSPGQDSGRRPVVSTGSNGRMVRHRAQPCQTPRLYARSSSSRAATYRAGSSGGRRSSQSSSGGARTSAASGSRSRGTAIAAGTAAGHQVLEMALPSGLAAASVPPPARRAASSQAVRATGPGQGSPVRPARRLASSAIPAPATAAPAAGRPDAPASQASAVQADTYRGRTAPGWRSSRAAAEVP